MEIRGSFGSIQTGITPGATGSEVGDGVPFRIAVLGDFSGRANRGIHETGSVLSRHRPRMVDRDNYEELLDQLGVRLTRTIVGSDHEPVTLEFHELNDFHPDRVFSSIALFESLRQLRRQLINPSTFDQAANEVRSWGELKQEEPATPVVDPANAPPPPAIAGADLLDQVLAESGDALGGHLEGSVDWQAMIRDIVEPYSVPGSDPQLGELVACVDAAIGRSMQTLLHHCAFQELEAAWRGLYLLVRRLETDTKLKLFLIDVSKAELAADLCSSDDLTTTGLYQLLVEQTVGTPGGHPWSVLLGNYMFDQTPEDIQVLGRMAKIAHAAGAPFISSASGNVVGCPFPDQTPEAEDWAQPEDEARRGWNSLRELPESASLGLIWPRFLLRLPYGKKTNPTEEFEFEEMSNGIRHESYLWGNGAFVCSCLLGEAFTQFGWDFHPGQVSDLSGMPIHIYQEDGESVAHPCGELLLKERGIQRVAASGLMPLLSVEDQDTLRMSSFNSVQGNPLAGRWC